MNRPGTVVIIGVGLIGGSIGLALRARGLARRVVGVGRDPAKLAEAIRLGAIDEAEMDLKRAASDAEVAVVCTPVARIAADSLELAEAGSDRLLITDAGSTKAAIVDAINRHPLAIRRFVGAHPIAGAERHGVAHARVDLFERRVCILTPSGATPAGLTDRCRGFWESIGSRVVEMDPSAHDAALALTSHLPHVVASALAATVPIPTLPLAAGAYRDGTRVAASDGRLWAEIFLANSGPTREALASFRTHLDSFEARLDEGDVDGLVRWWEEGRHARSAFQFEEIPANRGPR